MKKFICKQGASNYYLVNDGMGGFLNPPNHPEHDYSIIECRGGHEVGSMSLSYASTCEYLPGAVRGTAKGILKRWNSQEPDPAWLDSVYNYFRHGYSIDGIRNNVNDKDNIIFYGKFWNNAEQEQNADPTHSLAYLYVKEFYPNHAPDLDRLAHNCNGGSWSTEPK